jgi:hypothetical protein
MASMPDSFYDRDGWVVRNQGGRWVRTEQRGQQESISISESEATRLWNDAGQPSR